MEDGKEGRENGGGGGLGGCVLSRVSALDSLQQDTWPSWRLR